MEQTQNATIAILAEQLHLQTRLLNNVVKEINESQAANRLNENINSIAWLTGHLVSTRHFLATMLGIQCQEPYPDLFGQGKGIQDVTYPSVAELTEAWQPISEAIAKRLGEVTEEEWNAKPPFELPVGDNTLRGLYAFLMHHEAYHIGQLAILRKHAGHAAMAYN